MVRTGAAALVLGLLCAGSAFGWLLRGWVPGGGVGTTTVEVTRPIVVEAEQAGPGTLPNVLGLGVAEARQAYADAGVDPSSISVVRIPYVAQKGTVVEQRPGAAAAIPQGLVDFAEILVAKRASMPDLVGVEADEARSRLAGLGVGATTVVRYDATVAPGEVAETVPAAGVAARPRATLVVSEAPSSVNLADLSALEEGCYVGEAELSGSTLRNALVCELYGDTVENRYKINARVTAFKAAIALADGSRGAVRLNVLSDGRLLGTFETSAAETPINVAIAGGGSRLTLELKQTANRNDSATLVFRDARIVGARSGIDALVRSSAP
jgi:hypothetical protein